MPQLTEQFVCPYWRNIMGLHSPVCWQCPHRQFIHVHHFFMSQTFQVENGTLVLKSLRSVGDNFLILGIWRLPKKLLLGTYRRRNCCYVPLYFSALDAHPVWNYRAEEQLPLGSCTFPVTHVPLYVPKWKSTGEKIASFVPKPLPKCLLCCQTNEITCCQFLREDCSCDVFKQCWVKISKIPQDCRLRRTQSLEELPIWHFNWVPPSKATRDFFTPFKNVHQQ